MKKALFTVMWVMNLVLYLVVIALWITLPNSLTLNLSASAAAITLTLLLMLGRLHEIRAYVSSTYFEKLTRACIQVALVAGILGLVNYLAFKNSAQWDVSQNKSNSLSQESVALTRKIAAPMQFKIFADKETRVTILPLFDLYKPYSSFMEVNVIDPALNPELVNSLGIKHNGEVLVEYQKKTIRFTEHSELAISGAIKKLLQEKHIKILFTAGHGELDINKTDEAGLSLLKDRLTNTLYEYDQTSLTKYSSLKNFQAVVILGGEGFKLPQERQMLADYLKGGGSLFVALDPDYQDTQRAWVRDLVSPYGIDFRNDIVVDIQSHVKGSRGLAPIISSFNTGNPVLKDFQGTLFFPLASSVEMLAGITPEVRKNLYNLFFTSAFPNSWGKEVIMDVAKNKIEFDKKNDRPGPISMAVAFAPPAKEVPKLPKIVAIGNAQFLLNKFAGQGDNQSFFLNALAWLADDDFTITFDPIVNPQRPMLLNAIHLNTIFYFSVVLVPLILFAVAVLFYRIRRKM